MARAAIHIQRSSAPLRELSSDRHCDACPWSSRSKPPQKLLPATASRRASTNTASAVQAASIALVLGVGAVRRVRGRGSDWLRRLPRSALAIPRVADRRARASRSSAEMGKRMSGRRPCVVTDHARARVLVQLYYCSYIHRTVHSPTVLDLVQYYYIVWTVGRYSTKHTDF